MLLYLLPAIGTQPTLRLYFQQASNQIFQFGAQTVIVPHFVFKSLGIPQKRSQISDDFRVEGGLEVCQFIKKNSKRPEIKLETALFFADELRGKIEMRARFEIGLLVFLQSFGNSEICDFSVPVFKEQDVFWLEVAVENVFAVELLEPKDNAACQKPDSLLSCFLEGWLPATVLLDERVAVSTLSKLHGDIVMFFIAKCTVNLGDEFRVAAVKDVFLNKQAFQLFSTFHLFFIYNLYGKVVLLLTLLRAFERGHQNLCRRAPSNDPVDLEVPYVQLSVVLDDCPLFGKNTLCFPIGHWFTCAFFSN